MRGIAIKKPIPVEFIELVADRNSIVDAYEFIHGKKPLNTDGNYSDTIEWFKTLDGWIAQGYMPLKTLESGEGTQNATFGDYILKGIDGECWPIKADIFERTYDITNK